jgi:hypothetical protein
LCERRNEAVTARRKKLPARECPTPAAHLASGTGGLKAHVVSDLGHQERHYTESGVEGSSVVVGVGRVSAGSRKRPILVTYATVTNATVITELSRNVPDFRDLIGSDTACGGQFL